jgi:hypothetical protein
MTITINDLSDEAKSYIINYWNSVDKLNRQMRSNINKSKKLESKLLSTLTKHVETSHDGFNIVHNLNGNDLIDNLTKIISKCSNLLEQAKSTSNEHLHIRMRIMDDEYVAFLKSNNIDLDDRSCDEELYDFIHGSILV